MTTPRDRPLTPPPTTRDAETPSDGNDRPLSGGKRAASFGDLAKRIRGRTTDLLAVAVILVGGFVVGGQVSRLWDSGESRPQAQNSLQQFDKANLFDGDEPVELDFGSSPWSLQRSMFAGTRKAAGRDLLAKIRIAAKTASPPTHPTETGERRLLEKLAREKSVEETDGRKLYRVDGPVIMASVTAPVTGNDDAQRATAGRRVVCWGLAFPASEKRWVAYLFQPRIADGIGKGGRIEIPLPPLAKPVLTIRGRDSLTRTFRADATVERTGAFYAKWFTANGWRNVIASESRRTAAYERTIDAARVRAELRLSAIPSGGTSGLIIATATGK